MQQHCAGSFSFFLYLKATKQTNEIKNKTIKVPDASSILNKTYLQFLRVDCGRVSREYVRLWREKKLLKIRIFPFEKNPCILN